MLSIHPSALVDPKAELGQDVVVGPFSVVEAGVVIGDGTVLASHIVIHRRTKIGKDNRIGSGTILGAEPQDKKFRGEATSLVIGDRNEWREYCSVHRAVGEGEATVVGNDNYFMTQSHVGHNCRIGDRVILTNLVAVAGHCQIEDGAVIGGMVGIHQFVRIGTLAMVGGCSAVRRDVPPYALVEGIPARLLGINRIGLRRAGVSDETISELHQLFGRLFFSGKVPASEAEALKGSVVSAEAKSLLAFVTAERKRAIVRP